MQAIYGNAASSEKLKEQFYSASQTDGESVVDYSLSLSAYLASMLIFLKMREMRCFVTNFGLGYVTKI